MQEVWKDIKGFEAYYQISNLGRVKRLSVKCGTVILKEKIRSLSTTLDGYVKVRLQHGSKDVTARVHRLVATHFLEGSGETVNHKDGDKKNNRVDNLEWMDRREQLSHAYRLRLKKPLKGLTNPNAKLSKKDVEYIRSKFIKGNRKFGASALGRKFGVTHRVILNVVYGLAYKDV
jgi:DNA endonuclease I-hmuI